MKKYFYLSFVLVLCMVCNHASPVIAGTKDYVHVPIPVPLENEEAKNIEIVKDMKWIQSGHYYYEVINEEKKEATLRRIDTVCEKVVIPSQIDGYTIISVGANPDAGPVSTNDILLYSQSVKEIIFPDTVTYIGPYAFYGCALLQRITFGASNNIKIQEYAFANCENLQDLSLSNMTIGPNSFAGNHPIKKVTIGKNVSFFEIVECEWSSGICPFGERKVVNMYVEKDVKQFSLNLKSRTDHLYLKGKSTVLSGSKSDLARVKALHTLPNAKAIGFARKKKKSYDVMSCKANVGKLTRKNTKQGLEISWKKAHTKVVSYKYKKKKWKKTSKKIPAKYIVTAGKDKIETKLTKALDHSGGKISITVKASAM